MLNYSNSDTPMPGDRIRNQAGKTGTVTSVLASSSDPGASRITIKWDEGIIEIDYPMAEQFTLISRSSAAHSK